jgi:hypothetical protein
MKLLVGTNHWDNCWSCLSNMVTCKFLTAGVLPTRIPDTTTSPFELTITLCVPVSYRGPSNAASVLICSCWANETDRPGKKIARKVIAITMRHFVSGLRFMGCRLR